MDVIEKAATDSEGDEADLPDNSGDEQPPNTGMGNKMVDTLQNFAETLTTRLGNL